MKKIFSLLFALLFMAGTTGVFTSCQEDAPEINYTLSVTVNNDFTEVVNAINNGTLKQEAAVAALTAAIEKMQGDQDSKQQAIADAINDLAKTTDAKLAIIEAAMKAQILSQEEASAKIHALLEGIDTAINPNYVTFTADAEQKLSYEGSDLQYSTDGITFKHLSANTPVTFGGDDILYLRGVNNMDGTEDYKISFGNNEVPVACTGDIRTLIDYKTYKTVDTSNATFKDLFRGCTELTSAPELPATTLADDCYENMFFNCTSLEEAPALPATTLAQDCYYQMFYGCTSLTEAPALPATTLAQYCYSFMFYGCTSLTEAPALPATTLAVSCYNSMFRGCTSLETAPVLPATTLAYACYNSMFEDCTSLETAPVLPATTLANFCYYQMFYGCTSLKEITMLATVISADYCLDDWVKGVTTTDGTFTKAASMTSLSTGDSGIPTGWTVVNQ